MSFTPALLSARRPAPTYVHVSTSQVDVNLKAPAEASTDEAFSLRGVISIVSGGRYVIMSVIMHQSGKPTSDTKIIDFVQIVEHL